MPCGVVAAGLGGRNFDNGLRNRRPGVPHQALIDAGYTTEEAKTTKIYHARGALLATSAATRAAQVSTKLWKLTMSSAN